MNSKALRITTGFFFGIGFLVGTLMNPDESRAATSPVGRASKSKSLATDLYFRESNGLIEEHSIRSGPAAAHIYLEGGTRPYFFFAFPQGNSGVGIWFRPSASVVALKASQNPTALIAGHGLNGASIDLQTNVRTLTVEDSVLGSMRRVRDRELNEKTPDELQTKDVTSGQKRLTLRRKGLNELADYILEIEALGDTTISGATLSSPTSVQFRAIGLTSEKPLTPIAPEEVFTKAAIATIQPEELKAFSFLLYEEKLMAGSPRYLSKFGRDSLYTLHVLSDLAKIIRPEALESLLIATLSSTNPTNGRVSHEQHEGDFASWDLMREKKTYKGINAIIEDYKMIDADIVFSQVLAMYLKRNPTRARGFLSGVDQRGLPLKQLVLANFKYVLGLSEGFAANPIYSQLVRNQVGEPVGNWRDSVNGLGGGVYPFDVNAAFMPGALKAISELYATPGTEFYNLSASRKIGRVFQIWNEKAPELFMLSYTPDQVVTAAEKYMAELKMPARKLKKPDENVEFPAVALGAKGEKIPIMHSDDSLMMVFGHPSQKYLRGVAFRLLHQFPMGLATPLAILVANPVFATSEMKAQFDDTKYHGRVSWKMQEDMMVFGIDEQLKKPGLDAKLRSDLLTAREEIEQMIEAKASLGNTEVIRVVFENGKSRAEPFAGDAKSNSNQLWSHLRIGRKPKPMSKAKH